jgi:demethylmenaquinone methyltransferase/2-methoxy-6-polyprenyl-1,4-benzoquinol methylase
MAAAMADSGRGRKPDLPRSQEQYRRRAAGYDTELIPFEPFRVQAIERLALHAGETVIDVGAGTGLSFERLVRGVGPAGRVVAVEPSPDMMERAQERVARHGWRNVELVTASAAGARLRGRADAALFHFVHDVLRDPASLANVLAHLKPGARVAATGLQWAPAWAMPVNCFVLGAAAYSLTSFDGLGKPWDRLAEHLDDVHVETAWLGGIYIASGRYRP